MDSIEIRSRLTEVFRDIFDDPNLTLTDSTSAADIDDWDSLTHVNLIVQIEKEFRIRLSTAEVRSMGNVGDLIELIARKAR
jgi:acyl carrier protein